MKTTTNVSLRADRAYVLRLKRLALDENKDMADVVRVALDGWYGDKLAEPAASSLAPEVPSTEQIPA